MNPVMNRAFVDLEIRSSIEGRTIHGIVVPFGRSARVSDGGPAYDEMFRYGAFTKTIAENGARVKLLSQHQQGRNPLGRASLLREDTAGLYGEFTVSRTAAGDEALELVRDGALDSFSVGFAPINHVRENRVVVRTEVALREASLVTFPSYVDALVGGVRSMSDEDVIALATRLDNLRLVTPAGEPAGEGTSSEAAHHADVEPREHSVRSSLRSHIRAARIARHME